MIKIIASDMDGTLLDENMLISKQNAAAIKKAQAAGITFVLATGRQKSEIAPLLEHVNITAPLITLNGAQVLDVNGKELDIIALPKPKAHSIFQTLRQEKLYFEVITNEGIYSNSETLRIENFAHLLVQTNGLDFDTALASAKSRTELKNINYVASYEHLLQNSKVEITKIVAFDPENKHRLLKIKNTIELDSDIVVTQSSPGNIEINHRRAQKGIALTRFAQNMDVDMKEVMAIGDNNNDVSMLKVAGVSYAMGNGSDEVKNIAKYTTTTNRKNGVAQAILEQLSKK